MKVFINREGETPPEEKIYFSISGNGIFLHKRIEGFVDAVVPVKSIDGLLKEEARAELLLPKITSTVFAKAVCFFNEVYRQKRTEALVLLHFSEKHGYTLSVPEQSATSGHIKYTATDRVKGYRLVGTMHSHCAMSAFHSATDTRDEAGHDGVHITIGRLDSFPSFGFDAELVVNGTRFPLSYEHVIRLKQLPKDERLFSKWFRKKETLYTIPFGILRDWSVPGEWIDKVDTRLYTASQTSVPTVQEGVSEKKEKS